MKTHFGPWTTAIDTGSTAQLSAFWQRRLKTLPTMNRRTARVSSRSRIVLAALAMTAIGFPALRFPDRVAAAPGAPRDAADKNDAPAAGAGQPVRVTLPGGAVVELLGLGEHPSHGSPWWAPDGEPTAVPYRRLQGNVTTDAKEVIREIAIRWIRKSPDDITTSWSVIGGGSTAGGKALDVDGKQVEPIEALAVAFPANKKTCLVRFIVASGVWDTLAETDGQSVESQGKRQLGFAFAPAYEHEGATKITIAHNVGDRDVRIVAVDRDGKSIPSSPASSAGAQGFIQMTASFPGLRLKDVKEFRVQSRVFQVVEIQNVSLQPGQQTRPKVVERAATPDVQSSNESRATWEGLGLSLLPVAPDQFPAHGHRYRGGLVVTNVTADGPAAVAGIQKGDVLVGLHTYETAKTKDVDFALASAKQNALGALKFYILRGGETLYGHMNSLKR